MTGGQHSLRVIYGEPPPYSGAIAGADVSAGDIRQIRFVGLLLGPRLDCHHHNDWSLTPHFRVRGASRGQCVQLVRKRDDA
jgi:hypothetical protein